MTIRPELDYTKEMADRICAEVADGSNLNRICKESWAPSRRRIYQWFDDYPQFLDNYARAREQRADARADRIDEICNLVVGGKMKVDVANVVINTYKWQAGHELPGRYRDKVDHSHSGPGGGPIRHVDLSKMTNEQLEDLERAAALLEAVGRNPGRTEPEEGAS